MYVLNEDINEQNPTQKREGNSWYKSIWNLDNVNLMRIFRNEKCFNWGDVGKVKIEYTNEDPRK